MTGGRTTLRAESRAAARREALRAEAMDVRERFLRAIVGRVPAAQVAEVHLFAPIRQGTTESGVALVALSQEAELLPDDERRPERHTICTARYRLTVRGPDRGRWEFDLVEEADAPLTAVDEVIRGVHERAGESSDCDRLSGDEIRALSEDGQWTSTP